MSFVYPVYIAVVLQLHFMWSCPSDTDPPFPFLYCFSVMLTTQRPFCVFTQHSTDCPIFQPISSRPPYHFDVVFVCAVLFTKSRPELGGWAFTPFLAFVNNLNSNYCPILGTRVIAAHLCYCFTGQNAQGKASPRSWIATLYILDF